MKLILFRHADKSIVPPGDPELTPYGKNQALQIAQGSKDILPPPNIIFSSPKTRAIQTLTPLSELHNVPIQVLGILNERKSSETASSFIDRIQQFIKLLNNHSVDVIYAVSHYDWVAEFCLTIDTPDNFSGEEFQHWGSAQYLVLNDQNGQFHFIKKGRFS